jgi:hypothetical protein
MQFESGEMRTSEGMEWKIVRIGARNLLNQQETIAMQARLTVSTCLTILLVVVGRIESRCL